MLLSGWIFQGVALKIFSRKIDGAKPGTVSRKHCSHRNGAALSYFLYNSLLSTERGIRPMVIFRTLKKLSSKGAGRRRKVFALLCALAWDTPRDLRLTTYGWTEEHKGKLVMQRKQQRPWSKQHPGCIGFLSLFSGQNIVKKKLCVLGALAWERNFVRKRKTRNSKLVLFTPRESRLLTWNSWLETSSLGPL